MYLILTMIKFVLFCFFFSVEFIVYACEMLLKRWQCTDSFTEMMVYLMFRSEITNSTL